MQVEPLPVRKMFYNDFPGIIRIADPPGNRAAAVPPAMPAFLALTDERESPRLEENGVPVTSEISGNS